MRYKITIEYDGSDYCGWQQQKDQPNKSIEEILEKAIFLMTQEKVEIVAAGRTDAGVHALAQIAHFDLEKEFEMFRLMMGINNYLRESAVVVVSCEIAADNFHSRFDAKMRHYCYLITNRKAPLALQKNRAWHVPIFLDIDKMREAANHLVGTHDFSAFCDAECQSNSPIKTVEKITIEKNYDEIVIEISAKSFLHHMVRNIVGTLMWVGSGRVSVMGIKNILASKDRKLSGPNAPACGLYFVGVDY